MNFKFKYRQNPIIIHPIFLRLDLIIIYAIFLQRPMANTKLAMPAGFVGVWAFLASIVTNTKFC